MGYLNRAAQVTLVLGIIASIGCTQESPPVAPAKLKSNIEAATEAVRISPNFETYLQLGIVQLGLSRAEEAMKSFEQSVRLNPKSAIAYNNLCVASNEMKHWSSAIDACEHALSLAPEMQLARNNLRFAKDSQKKTAERISALESKSQTSQDGDVLIQLGMEFYATGEYEKAISTWKKVLPDSKQWGTAQNDIASAAILKRDFPLAKMAIEKALATEPHNTLYLNNRNWLARAEKEAGGG